LERDVDNAALRSKTSRSEADDLALHRWMSAPVNDADVPIP